MLVISVRIRLDPTQRDAAIVSYMENGSAGTEAVCLTRQASGSFADEAAALPSSLSLQLEREFEPR